MAAVGWVFGHHHEANRAVGKAVRFVGRHSKDCLPEGMHGRISSEIVRNIGYPLNRDFRRIPRERARKHLGYSNSERLLMICGVVGSFCLNQWLKDNLRTNLKESISYCITGLNKEIRCPGLGNSHGNRVYCKFVSFCDEMNYVLSAIRSGGVGAGAESIAEIICCRVPSILVPYPYAAENHQQKNASYLESEGRVGVYGKN